MSDQFGFLEGAKGLSGSLDASRSTAKELSKSIENVQKEATDVAVKKAQERKRQQREAEFLKERAIIKALDEYKRRKKITDEEYRLKVAFIKQYGTKEWESVLKIKNEIEALEKHNIEEFQHDLKEVKRVQFICFAIAGLIAYYLTWGHKQ
jgi:hypothetical protein